MTTEPVGYSDGHHFVFQQSSSAFDELYLKSRAISKKVKELEWQIRSEIALYSTGFYQILSNIISFHLIYHRVFVTQSVLEKKEILIVYTKMACLFYCTGIVLF